MNDKIKVLWFCSATFSDIENVFNATWLHTMAYVLIDSGEIQFYNITQGCVKKTTRQDYQAISQWVVPIKSLRNNGLPGSKTIKQIQNIVDEINPDIIHIWGTESYWGLLTARGYIKGKIILEIQGLKFVIEKYFYSGLTLRDILKCFGFKELLKPSVSLIGLKYSFKRWGKFEKEMLLKHRVISTQSDWVRAHVKDVNPNAQIYVTSRLLRPEFIVADKWEIGSCVRYQVFTSTSFILSYKGLHVLLAAISVLKNRYPQIKLCIASNVLKGFRQDGYSKWLKKRTKQLGIDENIFWLGPLDAKNLILQMHKANVVVVPSFVESYCFALDESLTVGVPTVASFSGAMPELATHEKSALYFPPGDVTICANAIEKLFLDSDYATELSWNAYNEKKIKTSTNLALSQLAAYRKVIDEN